MLLLLFMCLSFLLTPQAVWSLAFPTAEGYGANASGGRGGVVHKVTSLADSGPGTLRECIDATGPRTCIFEVSGTITLQSDLVIQNGDITIAGQTAPNQGVQIRDWHFLIHANNVIIRHLKFRPGVEWALAQGNNPDSRGIELGAGSFVNINNVILDHVEVSWTGYQSLNFFGPVTNVTVQWSLFCCAAGDEDPIQPGPPGDEKGFNLAYGSIMTSYEVSGPQIGQTVSFHHNLINDFIDRIPQFSGRQSSGSLAATVDLRNNFFYGWTACTPGAFGNSHPLIINPDCVAQGNCADGPFDMHINAVGNRWELIPSYVVANPGILNCTFLQLGGSDGASDTQVYVEDNQTPFCSDTPTCANPWDLNFITDVPGLSAPQVEARFRTLTPHTTPAITTHTRAELVNVLVNGTATAIGVGPRKPVIDSVTQQALTEAFDRTGVRGRNGTWPDLTTGGVAYPPDTDEDGLPNQWEIDRGLDPQNNNDARQLNGTTGYTHLEDYLNFLAGDTAAPAGAPVAVEFLQHPTSDVVGVSLTPPITVRVIDDQGATVMTATNAVTLAIGTNPGGATLAGTVQAAAINGIATFSNISLNQPGVGYTLIASSPTLTSDTSLPFNINLAPDPGTGLRVNPINSRYLSNAAGQITYLAGAYDWNFLGAPSTPEFMDLSTATAYLDQWVQTGQNIVRGINWDPDILAGIPDPPFNNAYYDFVETRIALAQSKGIYVLFNILHFAHQPPVSNLTFSENYVRNVVDRLGNYDNILFEVGNELLTQTLDGGNPGSFSSHIVDVIKARQVANNMPALPVAFSELGYTAAEGVIFNAMLNSNADIIIPGGSAIQTQTDNTLDDQLGAKVIIVDTDHIWPYNIDHDWAWRSLMNGLNVMALDGNEFYPDHSEDDNDQNSPLTFDLRMRIGDTRTYANRINLEQSIPTPALSTTGFILANPGVSYLVYQDDPTGANFDVTLTDHRYKVEWFDPVTQTVTLGTAVRGPGAITFDPPFNNNAVLLLEEEPEPQTPINPIGCQRCSGFLMFPR